MTWRKLLLGICRKEGLRLKDETGWIDGQRGFGCSLWSPEPGKNAGWNFEVGSGYYDESRFPGARELACREVVREWIDDRGIESPEEAELRLTAMGCDFDSLDDPGTVRSLVFGEDSPEPF